MYEPKDIVTSPETLREMFPTMHPTQTSKIIDHVDDLIAAWIARSTFLTLATVSAKGLVDVSPKGDPAGFVKVIDRKTIAIPDRPGNHRFDSFRNIMETGRIGLVFLVPHRNEVVRINGQAWVVQDMDLREPLAINGRTPDFAIAVRVEEAFYHCGKSIIRSALWAPDRVEKPVELPTYSEALKAHSQVDLSLEAIEERMAYNDKSRLYDE